MFTPTYSTGLYEFEDDRRNVISGGFKRESGELFAFWKPTNIMTTNYEHTVSFEICSEYDCVRLIDVMDGSIYELPNEIVTRDEFGTYRFKNLPIKDTPMLLEFGKFLEK